MIIRCPFYFKGICNIRHAPRDCNSRYNILSLFSNPSEGCAYSNDSSAWSNKNEEEYRCEACRRRISKEEYEEFNGLCRYCRGAPTQKGFPSPPGFPKF